MYVFRIFWQNTYIHECYLQAVFFLEAMILHSGYSLFCQLSRLYLKNGWVETLFFSVDHFSQKVSTPTKNVLETVQKLGKIVDIHFFLKRCFWKKNMPVSFTIFFQ